MTYFKLFKEDKTIEEVTKEEAERTLRGWWNDNYLDDIFGNNKAFRLYTPFAEVWTKDDKHGTIPQSGFYGIAE